MNDTSPEPETACCRPSPVRTVDENERFADWCKALGHPARLRLLQILINKQSCICGELVEMMPLSQSTVSQHLKILREAGLIQGEIDGPKVCYCINRETLAELKSFVAGL